MVLISFDLSRLGHGSFYFRSPSPSPFRSLSLFSLCPSRFPSRPTSCPVQTATHGRANKFLNNHNSRLYERNGAPIVYGRFARVHEHVQTPQRSEHVCLIPLYVRLVSGLIAELVRIVSSSKVSSCPDFLTSKP